MALIKSCRGKEPKFGKNCWLAENSTIVGDVVMGENCSVWFSAVVRGDVNSISIGNNVNIQDGVVIHCTYEKTKTIIGDNVSIGHNAIVHGSEIGNDVLIGMGAIIMDDCIIEPNTIIAAGTVLKPGTKVEGGSIFAGVPGKKVKSIDQSKNKEEIQRIAKNYTLYASWFEKE